MRIITDWIWFLKGADEVILYTQKDFAQEVRRLTNGQGTDFLKLPNTLITTYISSSGVAAVFDGVGKSTFDQSLSCLKRLGYMLSFGNASGKVQYNSLNFLHIL